MEEQIVQTEQIEALPVNENKKKSRYSVWIRLIALVLVISILMGITAVDFSLLRYQGTDQMVAAQYLMDSTSYLGQSRLERLKSLLTSVDSFSINLQAAEIAIGKTDYPRAAEFLEKCIPHSPDDLQKAELYNRLGCVYMLAEDPVKAQMAFDSSITLNPQEPTPYLLRGQLRYQSGDEAGAAQDAGMYLDLGGSDVEMLSTAASLCELGGDLDGALEAMNRKIRADADDAEIALSYAERGRIWYLQGREPEAKQDIEQAKKRDVSVLTGVHYAIIGMCGYNEGDYVNSRENFLQAARLSEDSNAEYYEQAILCGYLSEDFDFIKQTIAEAEEKQMMTGSSLLIEGILMFSEERYEEAETALTNSIEVGKVVVGTHYYRGLSRLALGKFETAIEDFTEALAWEDDTLSCLFNRGICYFALGEVEKGLEDLVTVASNNEDPTLAASAQELLESMEIGQQ
jgi:tetratricopeptide (TPR) repeat protein